jgi:hypothetical protein
MLAGRLPQLDPAAGSPGVGGSLFGVGQAVLIVVMLLTGGALLVTHRGGLTVPLVAVTGLVAAELAGVGIVSIRRWGLFVGGGYADGSVVDWRQGRVLAAGMGLVCAVVAVGCLVLVLRRGARWHLVRAAVVVPVAVVVAVAAPPLVRTPWGDLADLVAWALMYSLPFGIGLLLTAFLTRLAGLALVLTVAVSVLVAPLGESFLENMAPSGPAQSLVLIAAGATAVVLLVTRDRGRAGRRDLVASRY